MFLVFLKYGLIPVQVLSSARSDARRLATLNAELDFEPPVFGAPLNVTRFRIFFIVVFKDDFISEALDMDGFEVTFEFVFAMIMSGDTFRAFKVYFKCFLVFFFILNSSSGFWSDSVDQRLGIYHERGYTLFMFGGASERPV